MMLVTNEAISSPKCDTLCKRHCRGSSAMDTAIDAVLPRILYSNFGVYFTACFGAALVQTLWWDARLLHWHCANSCLLSLIVNGLWASDWMYRMFKNDLKLFLKSYFPSQLLSPLCYSMLLGMVRTEYILKLYFHYVLYAAFNTAASFQFD